MAIDYGSTGHFQQIGKLAKIYYQLDNYRNEVEFGSAPNKFSSVDKCLKELLSVFNSVLDDRAIARVILADIERQKSAIKTWQIQVKSWTTKYLTTRLRDDIPSDGTSADEVLDDLIEDMIDNAQTIKANTITGGTVNADSGNVGTGVLVVDKKNLDNDDNELIKTETIVIVCTSDVHDGATAGQEFFQCRGEPASEGGSGVFGTLIQTAADTSSTTAPSSGNRITDGSFENFTNNDPDAWTVEAGTVGTHILQETTDIYLGSSCLKFVGDLAQQYIRVSQTLSSLSPALLPYTRYALHARIKTSGVTAGTITIRLSGTGYTAANKIQINSNYPASWTAYTCFETLPKDIPSDLKIEIETDSISDAGIILIDHIALVEAEYFGEAGIYLAIFRGDKDFIAGNDPDKFRSSFTDDEGGRFQTFCKRLYNKVLPSNNAGGETISDTLTW